MKNWLIRLATLSLVTLSLSAIPALSQSVEADGFRIYFQEAYRLNPSIPKGMLEAVASANTRIHNLQPGQEEDHQGMPAKYGVMGLVRDGRGYFRNSLQEVAKLSGYSEENIAKDARINILAFAKAYANLVVKLGIRSNDPGQQLKVVQALSELPEGSAMHAFAMDSHLYEVMQFLNSTQDRSRYNIPNYHLKLEKVFGLNRYSVLSSPRVMASPGLVQGSNGGLYKQSGAQAACKDYPTALWVAASTSNYNQRYDTAITAVTIHTMQGSYAGTISWFQNPTADVSAHYSMRSRDGQITQMVCESDRAWHVGSENGYTVGIEHEGWVEEDGWYTEALYQSSANLVMDIAHEYNINTTTCYKGASSTKVQVLGEDYRIKGHQHFKNQSHTDPGIRWNWPKFYALVNPVTEVLKPMSRSKGTSLGFMAAIPENFRGNLYQIDGQIIRKAPTNNGSATSMGTTSRLPSLILFTNSQE